MLTKEDHFYIGFMSAAEKMSLGEELTLAACLDRRPSADARSKLRAQAEKLLTRYRPSYEAAREKAKRGEPLSDRERIEIERYERQLRILERAQ